jgi:hypothetical protein
MGRSVSHPSGAIVAFRHYDQSVDCAECDGKGYFEEDGERDECEFCDSTGLEDLHIDWREETEQYQGWIKELFPSFEPCDKWLDREDHAIAENRFAYFGISEYCGLVALWLVKKDLDAGYYEDSLLTPLADRWLAQVEPRFLSTFGELRKLGHMSNGEGVYQRID